MTIMTKRVASNILIVFLFVFILFEYLTPRYVEPIQKVPAATELYKTVSIYDIKSNFLDGTKEEIFEKVYYDIPLIPPLQDHIKEMCELYDVPETLVYSVIEVESNFEQDVISDGGDYGLMQINKGNHDWLSMELDIDNYLNPYDNTIAGVYLIALHLDSTDGDVVKALMEYNCGQSKAKELWQSGVYNTGYTDQVMAIYNEYQF